MRRGWIALAVSAALAAWLAATGPCGGSSPAGASAGDERTRDVEPATDSGAATPGGSRHDVPPRARGIDHAAAAATDGLTPVAAADASHSRRSSPAGTTATPDLWSARPGAHRDADGESSPSMELPGSDGVRATARLARPPRGLRSEGTPQIGLVEVTLDRSPARAVRLRADVAPPGALSMLGGAEVLLGTRRDSGTLRFVAETAGPCVLTLTPLDADGTPVGGGMSLPLTVAAWRDAPEPEILIDAIGDDDRAAGFCAMSGTSVTGIRATPVATLRVRRTKFAGFDTQATEVRVSVTDRQGIVRPVPDLIVIAAGEDRSGPVPIALADAEGVATLTFRSGGSETRYRVQSIAARWSAPSAIVAPAGSEVIVPIRLLTPALRAPLVGASADRPDVAVPAGVVCEESFAHETSVVVACRAGGRALVTVSADGRPPLAVAIVVVAPETVHAGGLLHFVAPPAGARGAVSVSAPGAARFADAPPGWAAPPGVTGVRGWGTSRLVVDFDVLRPAPAEIVLPARLVDGGTSLRLEVDDTLRTPRRAIHSIEVR